MEDSRGFLERLFSAAVASAQPALILPRYLPPPPRGRTLVLGAGKAASAMASVVDKNWSQRLSGLVVTRYGQGGDCGRIRAVEAGHPVPDAAGEQAAHDMLALCEGLTQDDLVLCLISGGGSALMSLAGDGISLAEKQQLNRELLKSGASIAEINVLRKHVSAIKGGRLAAACYPARLVTLLISDVPGDDPCLIASGPSLPDPSTAADALAVVDRYQIALPASICRFLHSEQAETPLPGDRIFANSEWHIIGGARNSLQAAAQCSEAEGVPALILSDSLEGEAREVGRELAAVAKRVKHQGQPIAPPCVLLSGGETTVTLQGEGRGGPNTEFNLALALGLAGELGITAIACDTDGIDGSEDNAGCFIDENSLERARQLGLDPEAFLARNDAWSLFQALQDLVVTGPTGTNVNDFRAIYVAAPQSASALE